MTSQIDPLHPPQGFATTAKVRENFAHAKAEIEALQAAAAAPKTTARADPSPPSSVTIQTAGADLVTFIMTENTLLDLAPGTEGQALTLRVSQDMTGGHALTLGPSIAQGSDLPAWQPSTGPGKTDYFGFRFNAISAKFDLIAINRGF